MENAQPPVDALRREIAEGSERDARAVLDEAGRDAAAKLQAARAEAEAAAAETLRRAHAQGEAVRKRILSGVHLEVQKRRLQVVEETLARMFALAAEKLEAFRHDKAYADFLDRLVLEGVTALDAAEIRVVPGAAERALLSKERLAALERAAAQSGRTVRLSLAEETLAEGGVLLASSDGRTRFDNRFSARIRRYGSVMRMKAMRILEK
jgi:vacuolar-type H+-ATPase subunit E/Vma4